MFIYFVNICFAFSSWDIEVPKLNPHATYKVFNKQLIHLLANAISFDLITLLNNKNKIYYHFI